MRDEHRQRNAFPGDGVLALIVLEEERIPDWKARDSAIEKEGCDSEVSGPAIEGVEGCN